MAILLYTFGVSMQLAAITGRANFRRKVWRIRLLKVFASVAVVYCVLLGGFDFAMHQPPETFSRVMMHVGPAPFLLFPFESMWKSARAGRLHIGDAAPDFNLPLLDHTGFARLSSFRNQRPVVLIFGSYT